MKHTSQTVIRQLPEGVTFDTWSGPSYESGVVR